DLQPAAGRTGDQLWLAHAPLRRLQDVERGLDFHFLGRQQADADGVADAVEQDRRQAARRFDDGVGRLTGLGDADVRRIVRLLRIEPIRFDGGDDVARLQRDDQVVIALTLSDLDVTQGALHHRGRTREAVLLDQLAFQAAGVDADAHRHALV